MKNNSTKILVCDDDVEVLEITSALLESRGFEVIAVSSSLQVMNILRDRRPELLLIDVWMPVWSGIKIILEVRNKPEYANLPIIAFSASGNGITKSLEAEAHLFIEKPFSIEQLTEEIMSLLKDTSIQKQLG